MTGKEQGKTLRTNESNPQKSIRVKPERGSLFICRHVIVSTFRKDVCSFGFSCRVKEKQRYTSGPCHLGGEARIEATQETVWRKIKMDLQLTGRSWGNGQNQSPKKILATERMYRLLHVFLCNGNCRQPDLSVVHTTADPHGIGIDPGYVVCNWKRS